MNTALQIVLDENPHPVWIYEPGTFRILGVNRAAIKKQGHPRERLLQQNMMDVFSDQEQRMLLAQARPIELEGQTAMLVVIKPADRQNTPAQETQILPQNEQFRNIFEYAAVGVVECLPDGKYLNANQKFCQITGYSREELLNLSFQQITHPDDIAPDEILLQEILAGKREMFTLEKRYIHKDGHIVWVELTVSLVQETHKMPTHFIGVAHEISTRKKRERDIQTLYHSSSLLNKLRSREEVGQQILDIISSNLNWDHATIWLTHESNHLHMIAHACPDPEADLATDIASVQAVLQTTDDGMVGWAIRNGVPRRVENVEENPYYKVTHRDIRSGLYAPLKIGTQTIGCISVESHRLADFDEHDERLLEILASQAAIAFENARLLEQTMRRTYELSALAQVSAELRTASTSQEIIHLTLRQISELFDSEHSMLIFISEDHREFFIEQATGRWKPYQGKRLTSDPGTLKSPESTPLTRYPQFALDVGPVAAVPLIVQEQVIGSLWIGRNEKDNRGFSRPDVHLLTSIAEITANALNRIRLHERTRQHAEQMDRLNELGRALASTLDLHQIYQIVYQYVKAMLTSCSSFNIYLLDAQKKELKIEYRIKNGNEQVVESLDAQALIEQKPAIQQAIDSMDIIIIEDPHTSETIAAAPMLVDGRVIGLVEISTADQRMQQDGNRSMFSSIANQVGMAIQNARMLLQMEKRVQQLSALRAIDLAISSNTDLNVTLPLLLEHVRTQLNVDAASILLLNPLTMRLEFAAGAGFLLDTARHTSIRLGDGIAGQTALKRDTVVVNNLSHNPDFTRLNLVVNEGFSAYGGTTLISRGDVRGLLEIFHRHPIRADQEWINFFEMLGGQAAIAIDNASLFNDLQRSNQELTSAYDATIEGWAQTLELRDRETEGHSRRVTEMALQLAQKVGIHGQALVHMRRGAILHDIGKIGVPDHILRKPGPLTPEEWEQMRQHPVYAYNLLSQIPYLRPSLDIPYAHHERWNGRGYPLGLKGEQIPLAARIFAIVDVYDALMSDRPYHTAMSKEEALAYLQKNAGVEFDPQLVEIFIEMIKD